MVFSAWQNAVTKEQSRFVIPLPGLLNSAQAEAVGSVIAKAGIILRKDNNARIVAQGDNAAVIGY